MNLFGADLTVADAVSLGVGVGSIIAAINSARQVQILRNDSSTKHDDSAVNRLKIVVDVQAEEIIRLNKEIIDIRTEHVQIAAAAKQTEAEWGDRVAKLEHQLDEQYRRNANLSRRVDVFEGKNH